MTTIRRNPPVLRFKDGYGKDYLDWEERRTREICEINPISDSLPNTFTYIDLESVYQGTLIRESIISKDGAPSRAKRILRQNDVLFQTVRPYQQNNYHFDLYGDYVASTGYAQLRSEASSRFLYYLLHEQKFVRRVLACCTGTSYPAINSKDIGGIKVYVPTEEEQQKIAEFLSSVDTRIEQLNRKKSLLEQYKKGMMQRLFSQEIRFKDEQGEPYPDWDEKRLGEVSIIKTGESNRADSSITGEYTFFDRSQDIRASNRYLFDAEAVIVAGEGQEFTPKYFIGKFDLHQRSYAIMNFNTVAGKFVFFYMTYRNYYFLSQAVGSTVKSLRLPMFQKMPLNIPCSEEQQKIADFLSAIDRKIELVAGQLEQARTFKKGLLQQMFI